jgi:site-specific DNA recombinase
MFNKGITTSTEEAAEKIRNLIENITVHPIDHGFKIELKGRLSMLLGPTNIYPNMRIATSGVSMVAREGLEPPTPGL